MTRKIELFRRDKTLERLPIEEREKQMGKKLQHLVKYAYQNAPGFKERLDKAGVRPGDIRNTKDLEKIPVLRKDDLVRLQKENPPFGGYLAVPISDLERIYQSPGPIYDPQRRPMASDYPPDFGKGQVVMNTWSYHITPAGLGIDQMLRDMGCTVFPAGTGNTELQVQVMHDLKVAGFVGTPSFLATIIKKAEERGYDFKKDFNLRWAMVSGEMGGDLLRKMFQEKYGIFCLGGDSYITADLGRIASSCDKNIGMHVGTDVIVEIVDAATGKVLGPNEIGEIVVTPFDEVYPLIRFGTGDISSLIVEPCTCGRTTPRLPKIMGRVGDAVRVRAMFVYPRQTDEIVSRFPEIAAYQLVVTRPENRDEMVMYVELTGELDDREKWLESLDKDFRNVCKARFDKVEFVARGTIPAGEKRIIDKRVYY